MTPQAPSAESAPEPTPEDDFGFGIFDDPAPESAAVVAEQADDGDEPAEADAEVAAEPAPEAEAAEEAESAEAASDDEEDDGFGFGILYPARAKP